MSLPAYLPENSRTDFFLLVSASRKTTSEKDSLGFFDFFKVDLVHLIGISLLFMLDYMFIRIYNRSKVEMELRHFVFSVTVLGMLIGSGC